MVNISEILENNKRDEINTLLYNNLKKYEYTSETPLEIYLLNVYHKSEEEYSKFWFINARFPIINNYFKNPSDITKEYNLEEYTIEHARRWGVGKLFYVANSVEDYFSEVENLRNYI